MKLKKTGHDWETAIKSAALWAQPIRREIHRHPERAFREQKTGLLVARHLRSFGLTVKTGVAKTGVTGLLRGKYPGKTIALRADMDALPLQEKTGLPYASRTPNVMHACGHDGHTAILLATAKVLSNFRDTLHGNVKFIFQPAEESDNGGRQMAAAGVLKSPNVDFIFALHARPNIPCGTIGYTRGAAHASADRLRIRVQGKGCHGARPEQGIDPVYLSASIVQNLQSVVSRRINALDSAVLSLCSIQGGNGHNIIPDSVDMQGTLRTFDSRVRTRILGEIKRICVHTAAIHGGKVQFIADDNTPAVTNNDKALDMVLNTARKFIGTSRIIKLGPSMGAEDFSNFLERVPGAIFLLGMGTGKNTPPLHSPYFNFNDQALFTGVRMMTGLCANFLS